MVLASFQTDANSILFGTPHLITESVIRKEYLSIILQTTRHLKVSFYQTSEKLFIKNLSNHKENLTPLLNTNLRVAVLHVENPISEVYYDKGENVTLGINTREVSYSHLPTPNT